MLVSFSVSNSRSFKNEATLLLTRAKRRATPKNPRPFGGWDRHSPVAGIYGANASGKSNFIIALRFFQTAIRESNSSWTPSQGVPLPTPFALDGSSGEPSRYEASFVIDGVRYQYGFEADKKEVRAEWLYSYPKKLQRVLFERDAREDSPWYFGDSLKGRTRVIAELTRGNSLFLSTAASNNHPELTNIFTWLTEGISFASPSDHESRLRQSIIALEGDPELRKQMLGLLKNSDLGIESVEFKYEEPADSDVSEMVERLATSSKISSSTIDAEFVREAMRRLDAGVELKHKAENGVLVALALEEESTGTQALIGLAAPIFEALAHGKTLVVDEIDTSLHPVLVRAVIKLFKSEELNRFGAQLIFTSHDVSLLMQDVFDEALLERDQIWFVEKHDNGESILYPLTDFKPRESHSLLRGYLQGRYGAVPRIEWRDLLESETSGGN